MNTLLIRHGQDDTAATVVTGLLSVRSPRAAAETPKRMGWDPREPGALALALILLLIGGVLPWWGFSMDTSRIPYNSSAGTDFGVWEAEEWQFQILPGTVHRDAKALAWWDFVHVHPEYADYGPAALATSALWTTSLLAGSIALASRFKPQSRKRGGPTALQGIAAGGTVVAIATAAVGFPMGAQLSFVGSASRLA